MSMEIWMTKSGIGDCILVRCGNDEQINLLVFTHDDNDHVKGACDVVERIYCKESGNINKDIPAGRFFNRT